jgi:hypothetical protein
MDEGLTTFHEDEAREAFFPGTRAHDETRDAYLRVAGRDNEVPLMRHTDLVSPYGARTVAAYSKPGTMLVALRGVVGRETFDRAMRTYATEWMFKHPYPWDFFNTFERVAGRDLDWFFYPWWFETGTLDYAVGPVRAVDGGVEVTITDLGDIPPRARDRHGRGGRVGQRGHPAGELDGGAHPHRHLHPSARRRAGARGSGPGRHLAGREPSQQRVARRGTLTINGRNPQTMHTSMKTRLSLALLCAIPLWAACGDKAGGAADKGTAAGGEAKAATDTGRAAAAAAPGDDRSTVGNEAIRAKAPAVIRGLYINAYAAGSRTRLPKLLAMADQTEINAFVIDVKDELGIRYQTSLEFPKQLAQPGEVAIRNLPALMDTLKAHKIWTIARIVVFKDPILSKAKPDWSVRRPGAGCGWTRRGTPG